MQALVAMPRCLAFRKSDMAMAENLPLAMAARIGPKKIPFPVPESNSVVIIDDPDNTDSEQDFCARDSILEDLSCHCKADNPGNSSGYKDSRNELLIDLRHENLQDHPADCRKSILVDDEGFGVENLPDEAWDSVKSPPTPQTLRDYKSWHGIATAEENSTARGNDSDFEDGDSIAANLMTDYNDLEEGEICPEICTEIGKEKATNVARNGAAEDETEYLVAEKSDSQHLEQLKALNALKRRLSVPSFLAQFKPLMKRARTKADCKKQRIRIWGFNSLSYSQNRDSSISSLQRLPHKRSSSTTPLEHLQAQRLSSLRQWPEDPFVSDIAKAKASATLPSSCHDKISDGKDSGSYKHLDVVHATSTNDPRTLMMQTLKTFRTLHGMYKHGKVKNADLRARSEIKSRNMWINMGPRIGPIPGVEVGDIFFFRSEVHIIGLHRQLQGGIAYLRAKDNTYGEKVAVSIVASRGYEDDKDSGDVLNYAGQGGNVYTSRNKRQIADQELTRGNLAMKNSYTHQLPIRVIRGSPDKGSPSGTIYSYDGLYKIRKYWFENGAAGFKVYQFELVRLPGQPKLETSRRYLRHQRRHL